MEIVKENEIMGYSHYTKSKLIDLLIKNVLINMVLINKEKQRRIYIININESKFKIPHSFNFVFVGSVSQKYSSKSNH